MKIWIIYDSKFGNNKKIAETLAEYFQDGNQVKVHYAKKISVKQVIDSGIDVFLFGGPPRAGMISFTMKRWAKKLAKNLNKRQMKIEKVAVWGTHSRLTPETPEKFSWNLFKSKWKKILDNFPAKKKNSEIVGFAVNPDTLKGPLDPGWEEIVKEMAEIVKNL